MASNEIDVGNITSQTNAMNSLTKSIEKAFGSINKLTKAYEGQASILSDFTTTFNNNIDGQNRFNDLLKTSSERLSDLEKSSRDASNSIENDLTESLDSVTESLSKARKGFSEFETNMKKTSDVLSMFTNPLSRITALIPGVNKGFSKLGGFAKSGYSLYKAFKLTSDGFGKFAILSKATGMILGGVVSAGLGAASLGFSAFGKAISISINLLKGFGKLVANVFGTLKDLSVGYVKSIFSIPMKIASFAAGIGNKLRKLIVEEIGGASEDSKKLFDHSSSLGKSIANISNQAVSMIGAFTRTNSEATKLFGDASNYAKKQYEAVDSLGQFADLYGTQITKNTKATMYYERVQQKLGLTAEDNLYIAREAAKNGEALFEVHQRRIVALESTSKEFDLDSKRLSKNFNKLRVDITNFGHLSNNELMKVTARATELGIEAKSLTNIFAKFNTFESAATSAAQLSQVFGMNVDALDLIRAKDPMEIVDMFREAMYQTGRSFDDLNRHEKALMASQTGMSAEQLTIAMNFRTMGKSAKETRAAMAAATPEARQIKAMKEMSGAVKDFKKTLQFNNLFDAVSHGIENMIATNPKLAKSAMNISKGYEGISNFIQTLDDVKDGGTNPIVEGLITLSETISNIGELLAGQEMKKALGGGIRAISNLANYLFFNPNKPEYKKDAKKAEAARKKYYTDMINDFGMIFQEGGPVRNILSGLYNIGQKIGNTLLAGFIELFPTVVTKTVKFIGDLANKITEAASGESSGISDSLQKWLGIDNKQMGRIKNNWSKMFKELGKEGGLFDFEKGPLATMYDSVSNKFISIASEVGSIIGDSMVAVLADNFPKLASAFGMSDKDIEQHQRKRKLAKDSKSITITEKDLVDSQKNKKLAKVVEAKKIDVEKAIKKGDQVIKHIDASYTTSERKRQIVGALSNEQLRKAHESRRTSIAYDQYRESSIDLEKEFKGSRQFIRGHIGRDVKEQFEEVLNRIEKGYKQDITHEELIKRRKEIFKYYQSLMFEQMSKQVAKDGHLGPSGGGGYVRQTGEYLKDLREQYLESDFEGSDDVSRARAKKASEVSASKARAAARAADAPRFNKVNEIYLELQKRAMEKDGMSKNEAASLNALAQALNSHQKEVVLKLDGEKISSVVVGLLDTPEGASAITNLLHSKKNNIDGTGRTQVPSEGNNNAGITWAYKGGN